MRFLKNTILFILFIASIHYWLTTKSYLFEQKTIVEIGNRYTAKEIHIQQFKGIISDLEEHYPGHIMPEQYRKWILIKSGGWIGTINILHASLTEYLVFTGTAIDSQGHSGRHWANITLVVLTGSIKEWKEGGIQATQHQQGDTVTLTWGSASSLQWKADTWTLEYGRGFIPFSLPFSVADSLFSSFDLIGIFKLFKAFAHAYYFEFKGEIAKFIASI